MSSPPRASWSPPSGYYARKARQSLLRRALSDAALAEVIESTFFGRDQGRGVYGVYGARKMTAQVRCERVTGDARWHGAR